jgi:hypothetical protein
MNLLAGRRSAQIRVGVNLGGGAPRLDDRHHRPGAPRSAARIGLRATRRRIQRDGKPDLIARFGRIPLMRKKNAVLHGHVPGPVPYPQKELIHRLLKRRCELCGQPGKVLVHQVRKLASLGEPGPAQPAWAAKMAQMRRTTQQRVYRLAVQPGRS